MGGANGTGALRPAPSTSTVAEREGSSEVTPEVRAELAHAWDVPREEATRIQQRLARLVDLRQLPADGPGSPLVAAGVDVAYANDGSSAWAVAVAMDRRFTVIAMSTAEGTPDSPYLPGFLAFREGRLTLLALAGLGLEPDVIFLDGHGVVHERGLGLASHVGVLLGVPTIGVPKTPFHAVDHAPGPRRGDHFILTKEWGAQGAAVRLKAGVKPVYVSPGHLVDLPSAVALSLAWSTGSRRVPEPLALAHTLSVCTRNAAAGIT